MSTASHIARLIAIFVLLRLGDLRAESSSLPRAELIELWEQVYNEPAQVLKEVRTRLAVLSNHPNQEEEANLSAIGAEAASFAEKNEDTLQLATNSIRIAEANGYTWALVHATSTLGVHHEFEGKEKISLEYYKKAIALADASGDPLLRAYALNNIGYFYGRNRSTKDAVQVLSEAIHALENHPRTVLYYDIMNNLAVLYTRNELVGRMEEGRKLLEQSFEYFKSRKMRYMIGNNYINLGLFYKQKNEVDYAIRTFREAIQYARDNHVDDLLPYYLSHLGDTLREQNRHDEALVALTEAAELFRRYGNNSMLATCLRSIAQVHLFFKNPQEALKAIQERSRLIAFSDDSWESEQSLEVEINVYKMMGDEQKELEAYRQWGVALKRTYDKKNLDSVHQITGLLELERKEADNKLLEEKDRTNTLRLEQADRMSRILIGLLACFGLLLGFMVFSLRQTRTIRLQRNRMVEVLNNIGEGILRFGKDFKVEAEYSRYLAQILEIDSDMTGQDVFTVLFDKSELQADEVQTIRAALSNILDEDELAWSLNGGQLPTELHRSHRILNLLWQPHYDKQQRIDMMLLVIRDVTSSKVLEAEVEATRQESRTMTHHLQEMLKANTRSLEVFMQDLNSTLPLLKPQLLDQAQVAGALRRLHTIKGNARGLGLMDMAEAVHQLESSHKKAMPLAGEWETLEKTARLYRKLYKEVFQSRGSQSGSLLSMVDEVSPAILRQLEKAGIPLGSLAVHDEVGHWPEHLLAPLRVLLLHGLSNAVDHGYVLSDIEPKPAVLRIEAQRRQQGLCLIIRDEGRGIRWERLKDLAAERSFKPHDARPLTDLLFEDGTTTSQSVSLSSGRGVGLAAVKEICQELKADVLLLDNDQGPGTMLVVSIPDLRMTALSA